MMSYKRLVNGLLLLVTLFMQGCSMFQVPVNVYKDGPSVSEQAPVQAITYSPLYGKSINALGYPVWLGRSAQGEPNVMMLLGRYERVQHWDIKDIGFYDKQETKDWMVIRLNNSALGNEDVTLIEIAIAGLSNGQVTRASKRFTGPVTHFNWVELFQGRVPRDSKGYLMEVDVALNYLDNTGYENPKQFFVHLPAYYQTYPLGHTDLYGNNPDAVFGSTNSTPFLNFNFTENSPFTGYDQISFDTSKTERGKTSYFYNASHLTLAGRTHNQFYYMNPRFLEHHGMLQGNNEAALHREALYSVYRDEARIEKLNQAMENIYPWTHDLSSTCHILERHAKQRMKSIGIWSSSGSGGSVAKEVYNKAIVAFPRRYEEIQETIKTSRAVLLDATKFISERANSKQAIDAREESLTLLYNNMTDIVKFLSRSEKDCEQAGQQVASLSGMSAPSGNSNGFLSVLGQALSNELASSYQPGYRRSGNYSGGNNMVADTMKQFHVDLKRNYEITKELQKQQQPSRNASYQARLNELRNSGVTSSSASHYSSDSHSSGSDSNLVLSAAPTSVSVGKVENKPYFRCSLLTPLAPGETPSWQTMPSITTINGYTRDGRHINAVETGYFRQACGSRVYGIEKAQERPKVNADGSVTYPSFRFYCGCDPGEQPRRAPTPKSDVNPNGGIAR